MPAFVRGRMACDRKGTYAVLHSEGVQRTKRTRPVDYGPRRPALGIPRVLHLPDYADKVAGAPCCFLRWRGLPGSLDCGLGAGWRIHRQRLILRICQCQGTWLCSTKLQQG